MTPQIESHVPQSSAVWGSRVLPDAAAVFLASHGQGPMPLVLHVPRRTHHRAAGGGRPRPTGQSDARVTRARRLLPRHTLRFDDHPGVETRKQCAAVRQTPWGAMGTCQGSLSAVAALWWLLFQAPSASPPGARMGSAMAVGPPLAARVTLQPVRASHGSNAGMAGIAGAVGSGWRGPRPSSMPARAAECGGPRRGHRGRAREAHAARRGRSGARRAGCAHSVPCPGTLPRHGVPTALPRIARSSCGFVRSRRGACHVWQCATIDALTASAMRQAPLQRGLLGSSRA